MNIVWTVSEMNMHPLDEDDVVFDAHEKVVLSDYFQEFSNFILKLMSFWKLFCFVLVAVVFVFGVFYVFGKPQYVATAIVGPPNPSPVSSMISSMGQSVVATMSRRIIGGGSSSNDPFQEYQQLVQAPRLFNSLSQDTDFMRRVFDTRWDNGTNSWAKPGPLQAIKAAVFKILHRPTSDHPEAEALRLYMDNNFTFSSVDSSGTAVAAALAGSSGYFQATLQSDSPDKAEYLLNKMLQRAGELIRAEQLRDVEARIAYLNQQLNKISQSDQRDALINVLSSQQSIKVMLVSDKRFAYVLVSQAYAPPTPVSPPSPTKALLFSIFISLCIWVALVHFEARVLLIRKFVGRFQRRTEPMP